MRVSQMCQNSGVLSSLLLTFFLSACAGAGMPTPPNSIADAPPSIMDSQPPAIDPIAPGGEVRDIARVSGPEGGLPPASSLPAGTSATQAPSYQVPASNNRLTFEPMVGAPKTVARELSQTLGQRVAQKALPVVARTDSKVTHRIKGYFSANQSGNNCIVSYVWDIFDSKGKRVNRVTGSQSTSMVSSNPWDSVTGPVLDKVAADTANKLSNWHSSL